MKDKFEKEEDARVLESIVDSNSQKAQQILAQIEAENLWDDITGGIEDAVDWTSNAVSSGIDTIKDSYNKISSDSFGE